MGSGGSGQAANQGVGSNLVPSGGSSTPSQGLAQSAAPGTTLNSNPVTPNAGAIAAGTVPPSFGQPFNTTTTGGAPGSGATSLAPGQTGNVNLSPWGQSQTPTPYSGTPAGVMNQNNGFTGGGSTQYGIPAGSQYVGSTPPSLNLSTPNWSGPALHQAIYQGNAYNVPSNVTQAMIGTGPGQFSPSQIPPWYYGPNNGVVGSGTPTPTGLPGGLGTGPGSAADMQAQSQARAAAAENNNPATMAAQNEGNQATLQAALNAWKAARTGSQPGADPAMFPGLMGTAWDQAHPNGGSGLGPAWTGQPVSQSPGTYSEGTGLGVGAQYTPPAPVIGGGMDRGPGDIPTSSPPGTIANQGPLDQARNRGPLDQARS